MSIKAVAGLLVIIVYLYIQRKLYISICLEPYRKEVFSLWAIIVLRIIYIIINFLAFYYAEEIVDYITK